MIAPEVVWVLGGSCVIGSVCAQQSCAALVDSSARLAAQEPLSSLNAFFFPVASPFSLGFQLLQVS